MSPFWSSPDYPTRKLFTCTCHSSTHILDVEEWEGDYIFTVNETCGYWRNLWRAIKGYRESCEVILSKEDVERLKESL